MNHRHKNIKIHFLIQQITLIALFLSFFIKSDAQFIGSGGLEWEDDTYKQNPQPALGFTAVNLPKVVSLKNRTPYPGDQGDCKTCVGWSVAYAALTTEKNYPLKNENRELISRNAFSPLYFNYVLDKSPAQAMRITDALDALKRYGDCLKTDLNLSCAEWANEHDDHKAASLPGDLKARALKNRINSYEAVFGLNATNPTKINATKICIANGRPVIVGIQVFFPSMMKVTGRDSIWKPDTLNDIRMGGHALCVIGYNDYTKTFELINSWGTSWGNKGYLSISYDDYAKVVKYGYDLSFDRKALNSIISENQPDFIQFEWMSAKQAVIQTDQWNELTFKTGGGDTLFKQADVQKNDYLKIKVYGRAGQDCYIYMLNQKPDHSFEMLFPFSQSTQFGPMYGLSPQNAEVPHLSGYEVLNIPGQNKALAENDPGDDILIFIVSKKPIADYNQLAKKLAEANQQGLTARLKHALGEDLYLANPAKGNNQGDDADMAAWLYKLKVK